MQKLKEIMVVDDEFRKPFGMNQLLETVNSALESKGSKSKRRENAS